MRWAVVERVLVERRLVVERVPVELLRLRVLLPVLLRRVLVVLRREPVVLFWVAMVRRSLLRWCGCLLRALRCSCPAAKEINSKDNRNIAANTRS